MATPTPLDAQTTPGRALDAVRVRAYLQLAGWWALSRAAVLGAAITSHLTGCPRGFFEPVVHKHGLGLLTVWDGEWYRRVAEYGYLLVPQQQSDPAFFPLYPILLRAGHSLGMTYTASGLVISNVAFLLALVALYELGRALLPERTAYRAAVLAAVFPLGYVFSMVYPESLVLAAISGAGVLALRRRWLSASALAAVAALARPEGALLVVPLGVLVWRQRRALGRDELGRATAAALAGPVALLTYPLYLGWSLHDVFAWQRAQGAWGRSFRPDGIARAFVNLPAQAQAHPWLYRDAVFVLVYIALLVLARRARVPWEWIAFGALVVCLPLASGSVESDGRFGLLALPVYWGLASATRRRSATVLITAISLLLLVVGTFTLNRSFP